VTAGAPVDAARVSLPTLVGTFAKIGLLSFGGALSGWMYREIVVRRRWITEEDFLSGLALGQIMPGANVANLSLYIGQRLRGGIGAAAALLGMLLPPMILVIVLAALYQRVADIGWVHRFIGGVAAAAIGLTVMIGIRATRGAARHRSRDPSRRWRDGLADGAGRDGGNAAQHRPCLAGTARPECVTTLCWDCCWFSCRCRCCRSAAGRASSPASRTRSRRAPG
jgi:chromate transporter